MNYRLATLLGRLNVTTDYTEDIDIDVKDPITQLVIIYDCQNGNQAFADGHPAECVTKVELVDGSDVLFSLSGVEIEAVDFYHNKREPLRDIRYVNGNWSYVVLNLNFGRYLYDPELALDPTRFSNLKLKVSMTRANGGSLSTVGRITVLAHLFDQKAVSPLGFLMHKELKSYTLGSASHEYTDLPLDHSYRKLFIRAQRDEYNITRQIANVKLSQDADKVVPYNQTMVNILRAIMSQTRPYRDNVIGPGTTTAQHFFCTPTYMCVFGGAAWRVATATGNVSLYGGDGGYFTEIQEAAGPNWSTLVQGWLPHAVFEIPFGLQNDLADWFNPTGIGNLKLDIIGGTSVGTAYCQIMAQQLRRY